MRQSQRAARPDWQPDDVDASTPNNPRDFTARRATASNACVDLFTPRQLVALTTFSDLVGEAREKALADARAAGLRRRRRAACTRAARGDGLCGCGGDLSGVRCEQVDRSRSCALAIWDAERWVAWRSTFGRQALPMIWDFAETNPLAGAGGDIAGTAISVAENIAEPWHWARRLDS